MSTHEQGHHDAHHDDWFAHTREEGLPQEEHAGHVDTRALLIFYVAMLAFVVVSVIGVTLFFQRYVLGVRQAKTETLNLAIEANRYKAQTLEDMTQYGWSGEVLEGSARIPLEEARAQVLRSYGQ
ncbi:MAG: hypothetical protein RIB58_06430 [Phycisphaerales bacterium]|jgi:hypothetical protein